MNYNPNAADTATQCGVLIGYLVNGGSITNLEAVMKFGIGRLASRIYDITPILRAQGYEVVKDWEKVSKANGNEARVMRYHVRPITNQR